MDAMGLVLLLWLTWNTVVLGLWLLVFGGITLYAWLYYTAGNLITYHYHKRMSR